MRCVSDGLGRCQAAFPADRCKLLNLPTDPQGPLSSPTLLRPKSRKKGVLRLRPTLNVEKSNQVSAMAQKECLVKHYVIDWSEGQTSPATIRTSPSLVWTLVSLAMCKLPTGSLRAVRYVRPGSDEFGNDQIQLAHCKVCLH